MKMRTFLCILMILSMMASAVPHTVFSAENAEASEETEKQNVTETDEETFGLGASEVTEEIERKDYLSNYEYIDDSNILQRLNFTEEEYASVKEAILSRSREYNETIDISSLNIEYNDYVLRYRGLIAYIIDLDPWLSINVKSFLAEKNPATGIVESIIFFINMTS